jgi:hypothetical protein
MEYLMTYGWAIFIIAVVMGSLAYLFFSGNASNLISPKASPGNCFVQLSYQNSNLGLSRTNRNLEGQCNNEEPQYVANFNGQNSIIKIYRYSNINWEPVTYSMWIKPDNCIMIYAPFCIARIFSYSKGDEGMSINVAIQPNGLIASQLFSTVGTSYTGTSAYSSVYPSSTFNNKWYYVATTYDGNTLTLYLNGVPIATTNYITSNNIPDNGLFIGSYNVPNSPILTNQYNGSIANLQLYNVSLSQSDIMQLYDEGIGGAPIALQNLAGWWPLNGNANDYSGVNNNGNAINVEYTTSWSSGYTQPQNFTT